jgi:O-antigen/teichoic acid export membrane protein
MKGPNRFYSSLGLLIILNLIIKPVWIFAIDRQVQNTLGTELYGNYFSLLNLNLIGGFLLDWGITSFLNRQLAAGKNEFSGLTTRFLTIKLLFAGSYTLVLFGVAWFSGIERWDILCLCIAIQVLSSLFIFLRGIITAQQWFRADAWLSVLDKALMILICGGFLYLPAVAGAISIEKFLLTQLASTFLAIIVAITVLQKKGFRFSRDENRIPVKKIIRPAFPYAVIIMLMTLHYRLDGFLLERMKNEYEAGIYAGAYRILDAANMLGYLAASFLLPYVARQWSKGQKINEVVLDIRHPLMLFSITTALVFFFLAGWFQHLLYRNPDPAAAEVLQWCLPALIGYSLVQVYGTVLTATGHIIPFCYIALGATIINILLNILLIPQWGAKGSCWAAIISQGLFGAASLLLARKKCAVTLHPGSLLLYTFIGTILAGFLYWFRNTNMNAVVLIFLTGLIAITAAFVTGLFSIKKWTNFPARNGS